MPLINELDYGTPESQSAEQITLTIDGQQVTVPAGGEKSKFRSPRV